MSVSYLTLKTMCICGTEVAIAEYFVIVICNLWYVSFVKDVLLRVKLKSTQNDDQYSYFWLSGLFTQVPLSLDNWGLTVDFMYNLRH